MRKYLFILLLLAVLAAPAWAAWWDVTYVYNSPINVFNGNTTIKLVDGHPLRATVNTATLVSAGKLQSNCQDARFIYNNVTVMPFLVENCNSATTSFIFQNGGNVSGNSNTSTMNFYYGKTSAATYTFNNRTTTNSSRIETNTIGMWQMNERTGTLSRDVKNGINLTLQNSTSWVNGYLDGGIFFDGGSNSYAEGPNGASSQLSTVDWTIEVWVFMNTTGGNGSGSGVIEPETSVFEPYGVVVPDGPGVALP